MRKTLIAATAAITLALAGCGAADSSTDKPEKTEISAARTAPADDNRPETTTSQKNVPPYAQLRVPARQAQVGIDSCSVTATDGCAKEFTDLVRAAEDIAELAAERGEVAVENQAQDIIDAKKTWGMNGCSQGYTPDIDVSSDGEILGASTCSGTEGEMRLGWLNLTMQIDIVCLRTTPADDCTFVG